MRTVLIALQAALITFLAVAGVQSGADIDRHCPLPLPKTDQNCDR